MGGDSADIFFSTKKKGSRERYFPPNQLSQLNQSNLLSELNQVKQVNKEIEIVSISKGHFFFRALGPMQFYLPLRATNSL